MEDHLADGAQDLKLNLCLEGLEPHTVEFITEKGSLALERLGLSLQMVRNLLDHTDVACNLIFTGDLVMAVNRRVEGSHYTLDRGSNIVAARTMRRPDGSYDILIGAEWLINFQGDEPGDVAWKTDALLHTMAQEPHHVLLSWSGTEAETFQDLVDLGTTERQGRKPLAIVLDEYRCEKAANKHHPMARTDDPFSLHLEHFLAELNGSLAECNSDTSAASQRALYAASELWKSLAYAIAAMAPTRQHRHTRPTR
jgi:hypothetical protein